jgi:phospholipid/cholesterol/gamma-HCH transport system ATP-binding protein
MRAPPPIEVQGLEMAYGSNVIMRDLNFTVARGEVFVIMGGSGCGKSTLLRHLLGLRPTERGEIRYAGRDFLRAPPVERAAMLRRVGVSFQGGGLWSELTLAENVALPLQRHTRLPASEIRRRVRLKLAWVGLAAFENYLPAEISGGMAKRAALARALALDPDILFFDEPSAGLDPVSSRRLDDLILQLRDASGTTVVVVTHELHSINDIADRALFLSARRKTMTGLGALSDLRASEDPDVRGFLARLAAGPSPEAPRRSPPTPVPPGPDTTPQPPTTP